MHQERKVWVGPSATRFPLAWLQRQYPPGAQGVLCPRSHQHLVLPIFWLLTCEWLLGMCGFNLHSSHLSVSQPLLLHVPSHHPKLSRTEGRWGIEAVSPSPLHTALRRCRHTGLSPSCSALPTFLRSSMADARWTGSFLSPSWMAWAVRGAQEGGISLIGGGSLAI